MTRARRFQTPGSGPSAGEKANAAWPAGERMGSLLLPAAIFSALFSGGVGYWLWATGYHDKAIIVWILTITLW